MRLLILEKKEITFGQNLRASIVSSEAMKLNFEFQDRKPIIPGEINGHSAKVMIDTGDRSRFTIISRFAESTKLSYLFQNKKEVISGYGTGGPIRAKWSQVDRLSLGDDFILKNVLT